MVTISKNNNKFKFSLAALVAVAALSLNLSICSMNSNVSVAFGTGSGPISAGSSTSNGAAKSTSMTAGDSFNAATVAISGAIGKTIDATFSIAGLVFVASGSLFQLAGIGITNVGEWTNAKLRAYPTFTTCLTATAAGAVGVYLFMQKRR